MSYQNILKKDKRLSAVLSSVTPYRPEKEQDIYLRLLRAIAGQQLSVKAARTIWERFLGLFPDKYPSPEMLIEMETEVLRQSGLSYQKAGYMKNIATFSMENNLTPEFLYKLEDDEVISYLCQIKGVGRWTVEMILMFAMGREDVFPADDLGIVNAIKRLYQLEETGKALKAQCIAIAEKWKPFRSYACFYLWPYKDQKEKPV